MCAPSPDAASPTSEPRESSPPASATGMAARSSVKQRLKSAVPGATVRSDDVDAARGAVRRARRLLGVEV
jgi:glucosamine kinase